MKIQLLLILLITSSCFKILGQNTATDFNVNDCGGSARHLFTELDAGKVIVFAMVDPCASCVNPAKSALNVVNSFASTNPSKVLYYLIDDFGNTPCATLTNWGATYGINNVVTISDASVNQNQYGGAAMPKIVVVGGPNHIVYFKQDNGLNTTNLTSAINLAINSSGFEEIANNLQVSLFPNPSSDKIIVSYSLKHKADLNFEIYNMLGSKVKNLLQDSFSNGKHESVFDITNLYNGLYFLKISSGPSSQNIRFTISK